MKTWKVWFNLGPTRFAMEFQGEFNFVCESAALVAKRLGAEFNYDIEGVTL